MPFAQHGTRAFTAVSIGRNTPAASGVYGLSNSREWIYVGEADDVRSQLLNQLRDIHTFPDGQRPTGFTYELCDAGCRSERRDELVLELEPIRNRHRPENKETYK
ncbi:MAG TPA: hypothetical protein VN442_05410 [Bryobacteraceae bacterium]|nr:hypothetical protein [Bryobacteraceae bacterium]